MQPQIVITRDRPVPRPALKPVVLLAEDDEDFRALLASQLERDGCLVLHAKNGLELLAAFRVVSSRTGPPSLVISDQRMPSLEGLEALERVRDAGWSIPLVLITAFGDDDLLARAQKVGAILMRKPFALEDLRSVVRHLVRRPATGAGVACAACGSLDDPRPMADRSDVFFCRDCRLLEGYDPEDPSSVDLGGES